MSEKNKLLLIDGSSFLYRAYYAAKGSFTTKTGIPTGATLLLSRMFKNLCSDYSDYKILVVFDAKGKSFRNDIYAEYKANRPPMPDDLRVQIENIHKIVKAMGLPIVSIEGVEADDVIGTYARQATALNMSVLIATGDKDMAQLVNDNITLVDTMTNVKLDRKGVFEKYGVNPELIIDFLALKGDSSDNIPGMAGVGDTTAKALLNGIGGINDIYENMDKIKDLSFRGSKTFAPKYKEAFDTVKLSYVLATIKTDVELPLKIEDIKDDISVDYKALLELYKTLEFKKMFFELEKELQKKQNESDIFSSFNEDTSPTLANDITHESIDEISPNFDIDIGISDISNIDKVSSFVLIDSIDTLKEKLDCALSLKHIIIDTETTSIRASDANLVGISFTYNEAKECFYVPIAHIDTDNNLVKNQLPLNEVIALFDKVLNDNSVLKIGHNLKYDLLVLLFNGFKLQGPYFDTMIAMHTINSSDKMSLDAQALDRFNYTKISYESLCKIGSKNVTIDKISMEKVKDYSCEDVFITYYLYTLALKYLENDETLKNVFNNQEMPLMQVLMKMEKNGIYLDGMELYQQTLALTDDLVATEKEIYALASCEFNIASPKQLGQVLFETLGIKYPKKVKLDKNGNNSYSTAEDILNEIAKEHEIAKKVLHYRAIAKLISTYTDKLPSLVSEKTGYLHTSFNQAGTVTGRLSSSDPNLQNIPNRSKEGRMIRRAFCAEDGYKILSADYSQIELRLIAHIANDQSLINAFIQDKDIHKSTAAEVLNIAIDDVTDEQRSQAKATNFGLMYGMGAHTLSLQTDMSFKEAKAYIDAYFTRYPTIKKYMENIVEEATVKGYVSTINKNKIYFENLASANAIQRAAITRAVINAPMQGSAADIIKLAMIEIQKYIDSLDDKTKIYMLLQVHDELVFKVRDDFISEATARIKEIMENVIKLKVPLKVGIGVGNDWGEAH